MLHIDFIHPLLLGLPMLTHTFLLMQQNIFNVEMSVCRLSFSPGVMDLCIRHNSVKVFMKLPIEPKMSLRQHFLTLQRQNQQQKEGISKQICRIYN